MITYDLLKLNQRLTLCGKSCTVSGDDVDGYFLRIDVASENEGNDVFFKCINVSFIRDYQEKILGYSRSGAFPECETLEDLTEFVNAIDKTFKMENKIITPKQAMSIIEAACNEWKSKLANLWAVEIVLNKNIFIKESFYREMRKACTDVQHELFDTIFGKDELECPYKDGELIWVESEALSGMWDLRYSNGKLAPDGCAEVYVNQKNNGNDIVTRRNHRAAKGIELPK